jgi:hypothetical protein
MLKMCFAVAVGLTAVSLVGLAARLPDDKTGPPKANAPADALMACAKACDDCKRTCEACGALCARLATNGEKMHLETLHTCQDCASLCAAAACIVARQGPFSDLACTACADACKRCGDACEKHAAHNQVMKDCAEECRKCEKACRSMLRDAATAGPMK